MHAHGTRTGVSSDRGRVGLVGFLVIALMVALLPPPASAQVAGFSDVRPTNVHAEAIAELAAAGILLGYQDGTFRPAASITRGQLASVIARAGEFAPVLPAPFSDTAGNPHEGPIGALAAANILMGYEDGTFRPYASISREHVAVVIARWLGVDPVADGPFTDVNRYAGQINALWEIGVVSGTTATTFSPLANIRRDQTASLVYRALGYLAGLEPGAIAGNVSDASSSHPIAGATVTVRGTAYTATTQADGRYQIAGVTPGSYTVDVTATGYDSGTRADVVVTAGAVTTVHFTLTPRAIDPGEGTIAGTVTDASSSQPIVGATVTVRGTAYTATTQADGRYEIAGVVPGTYAVDVTATGYAPETETDVVVTAEETTVVDFELMSAVGYDHQLTVRLNWQNQYREEEAAFGGVDHYAAFHLGDEGVGAATFRWDDGAATVVVEGEVNLTARATTFTLHEGGLDEETPAALTLTVPAFLGGSSDTPTEDARGDYRYSLGGTVTDAELVAALEEAAAGTGLAGWYVSVQTTRNPEGEARGQLGGATVTDGGLTSIVPVYKFVEFHELGEGTNTGEDQTSFNVWFDANIAFAGETGKTRPQPDDFVLIRERDGDSEELPILRVRGDNPDWQPYPKQDIRLHLDTHDVIEDGDIVTVTMLDSGASKLVPVGRNATAADLSDSWQTRCTHVISVPAMTSEPCGTPPQAGLSGYAATPIGSAPDQNQEFSVTLEAPGLPAGEELWIDLGEVSHDGLVDYSGSTWTATIDGTEVGTVEFWEYEEIERFQTVWEPFLVFTHTEAAPVAGALVLSGTGIDGSDAAVHGADTSYDTYVVRHDTGRADYTEIEVEFVPQPTITLEPADAVVLAEAGAALEVTATYTDVDGLPVADAELRFWAEKGERPDVVVQPLGSSSTDADGQTTVTYLYDGRDVGVGEPLIDTLHAQLIDDDDPLAGFVDARTTVAWATGVATNWDSGATFHDLNDADVAAEAGDTLTAVGEFTSVYGLPRDRVQLRTPDLTLKAGGTGASLLGAFDVRASGVTVDGFAVEHAGPMEYAFRVEGAGITISDNEIDANGVDGFRVRDAWAPVTGGGSATLSGNVIRGAAIAIDVDSRDQAGDLIVDLTIEGNLFEDNEVGIHYNADGGTPSIAGNAFEADAASIVYVRDATESEVLDLTAILAGNDYDPEGEILGRSIVPIDPTHVPSMVRVVEHGTGQGKQYTIIEYTRGVACDEDGTAVGSQFELDRGTDKTPNRIGEDVECGYDGNPSRILITWDGNPSFPNEITYTEHAEPEYRIHNEHPLPGGGFTAAESPDTVGSPFPKPEDELVAGAVYLEAGGATIDGQSFVPDEQVTGVELRVSIASRSEDKTLSLWFEGAGPDGAFYDGEVICAELLTVDSCTEVFDALASNDGFTENTQFLTDATLQVSSTAAVGDWQLRFWVVDATTAEPYFSDTFTVTIGASD
jgi:hypothetical protein